MSSGRGKGEQNPLNKFQNLQHGQGATRARGSGRGNFERSNRRIIEKAQVQCDTCGKQGHYSWEWFSENEEGAKLLEVDEGVAEPTLLLSANDEPKGGNTHGILIIKLAIT